MRGDGFVSELSFALRGFAVFYVAPTAEAVGCILEPLLG
jgi:hypothetical protein